MALAINWIGSIGCLTIASLAAASDANRPKAALALPSTAGLLKSAVQVTGWDDLSAKSLPATLVVECQPLGGAKLTLDSGVLTVDDLGSSGYDGVRADWGGVDVASTRLNLFADDLGMDSELQLVAKGWVDGVVESLVTLNLRGVATDFELEPAFGNAVTYQLQLNGQGAPVSIQEGLSGVAGTVRFSNDTDQQISIFGDGTIVLRGFSPKLGFRTADGQEILDIDEVMFVPEQPMAEGDQITSVAMTSREIPQFEISQQSFFLHGRQHEVFGPLQVTPDGNSMHLSNFDSAEDRGVEIDLDRAMSWQISVAGLFPKTPEPGAMLRLMTFGSIDGLGGQNIAETRIENIGEELVAAFEFSSDVPTYSLRIMEDERVVEIIAGLSGEVARFAVDQVQLGFELIDDLGPMATVTFGGSTTVQINGYGLFVGDRLEAYVDLDPPSAQSVEYLSQILLVGVDMNRLRVADLLVVAQDQRLLDLTSDIVVTRQPCHTPEYGPVAVNMDMCIHNSGFTDHSLAVTDQLPAGLIADEQAPKERIVIPANRICRVGVRGSHHAPPFTSLRAEASFRGMTESEPKPMSTGGSFQSVDELPLCTMVSICTRAIPLCETDPEHRPRAGGDAWNTK